MKTAKNERERGRMKALRRVRKMKLRKSVCSAAYVSGMDGGRGGRRDYSGNKEGCFGIVCSSVSLLIESTEEAETDTQRGSAPSTTPTAPTTPALSPE